MKAQRDPRIDPRPGDTVTVNNETREVERVCDGRVYYSWPGKVAVRSVFPSGWEAWTANASFWTIHDVDALTSAKAQQA